MFMCTCEAVGFNCAPLHIYESKFLLSFRIFLFLPLPHHQNQNMKIP